MSSWLALLLVVFSLTGAAAAPASDSDPVRRAQTHFRAGKTLYDLGNFNDAIREFAAGYALVPRPEFLINLAQAYRRAGELDQAKEMFQRYLQKSAPEARERPQVKEMIREIDSELSARPTPGKAPPDDRPTAPVLVPTPTLDPPVEVTAPAASEPSASRHLLWIIPLGVGLAAGITAAVYVAARPPVDACAGAGALGCFDLRPK